MRSTAANTRIAALTDELDKARVRIADLEGQIDLLASQRSLFFAALKKALGDRSDIEIVGDRFVFPSEVLFASGSDKLSSAGIEQVKASRHRAQGHLCRHPGLDPLDPPGERLR